MRNSHYAKPESSTNQPLKPVRNSLDAVLDQSLTEVNHEAKALIGEAKICKEDFIGNLRHGFKRLYLNYNLALHDQIDTKAVLQLQSL